VFYQSVLVISGNTLNAQKDRDDTINKLAISIGDAYAFIHLAEPLKTVESRKSIIMSLTTQTTQCGTFISDYASNREQCMLPRLCQEMTVLVDHHSVKITVEYLALRVDNIVKQYQDRLNKLRLAIQGDADVHTEIPLLQLNSMCVF
jgi:hypothetical protein